jgi:hypothetical protein
LDVTEYDDDDYPVLEVTAENSVKESDVRKMKKMPKNKPQAIFKKERIERGRLCDFPADPEGAKGIEASYQGGKVIMLADGRKVRVGSIVPSYADVRLECEGGHPQARPQNVSQC